MIPAIASAALSIGFNIHVDPTSLREFQDADEKAGDGTQADVHNGGNPEVGNVGTGPK